MHTRLLEMLICPACLPEEIPLLLDGHRHEDGDIVEGTLVCPACGARYAIADGLADLVSENTAVPPVQAKYDQDRLVASYLWSHYADLWDDPEATGAYGAWMEMLGEVSGPALDAGCAVGRFTLELAARVGIAVGVDLSRPFVSLARNIAAEGKMTFPAPLLGLLTTTFSFTLPLRLRQGTAEFVRADALRLPFRRDAFGVVTSLNIVDKVPAPREHLAHCTRVCAAPGTIMVSDPFSWSPEVAPPEAWLGGTPETGDSAASIAALLDREKGLHAHVAGSVWWTIRETANRYERIRSQVVVATKTQASR
ncbi:MAG: methyltransferase domain-containing protein [Solidesulfovibrio sp.]